MHATLEDLAKAKRLAPSYVSGILRLDLLAPEIVEAILDGRQTVELQLSDHLGGFPLEWEAQRKRLAISSPLLPPVKTVENREGNPSTARGG